jgi:methylenetetrahydrofolate dehydrogenase (NADP+) / methenyltetrahydrofolate cyclohydrolase
LSVIEEAMPTLLEGRSVAAQLIQKLKTHVEEHRHACPHKPLPQLAIVQVGDNPASKAYIGRKLKVAAEIGVLSKHIQLAPTATEAEIQSSVAELNNDATVHGIIVQLPLDQAKKSADTWVNSLIDSIRPDKDADGLVTANLGKLFVGESTSSHWRAPIPATALGVMRLLDSYGLSVRAKNCLVIGKSRLVGNPTAQLLLQAGATVSVVHSQSPDWRPLSRSADLIVVAAGVKHLLKPEDVREGSWLVDVGIHKDPSGLTGDVHPEAAAKSAAYTPVPGGVGQMTVACLMENLVELWTRKDA